MKPKYCVFTKVFDETLFRTVVNAGRRAGESVNLRSWVIDIFERETSSVEISDM
jgi:hypothetical protein